MQEGKNNRRYLVLFMGEFDLCLSQIEEFFAEQGSDTLQWWYSKEEQIIDYIYELLSRNPFVGRAVEEGSFKGLRRIIYRKSRHTMLNYLIYYDVNENERIVNVINILPSRGLRRRVKKLR